jgi:hypothetical protein
MVDIHNAKITSTMLGYEDHGCLTFWLMLDYGGAGQGFGGWVLDDRPIERFGRERSPSVGAGAIIAGLLGALELRKWEDLPGQIVRVRGDRHHLVAIGHALKEQWCEPVALLAAAAGLNARPVSP